VRRSALSRDYTENSEMEKKQDGIYSIKCIIKFKNVEI